MGCVDLVISCTEIHRRVANPLAFSKILMLEAVHGRTVVKWAIGSRCSQNPRELQINSNRKSAA